MILDRMAIDDIGPNSIKLAQEILRQTGASYGQTPLEEIAEALNIKRIEKKKLTGIEGALFVPEGKAYGEILLDISKNFRRTNFTLAHELGHYVHPLHHAAGNGAFHCTTNDMAAKPITGNHDALIREAEANIFASELIMPRVHLHDFLYNIDEMKVENIVQLSDDLFVSREALFRKIAELNTSAVAAYFVKENIVRYFTKSKSFPKPKIWKGHPIPPHTISNSQNIAENSATKVLSNTAPYWINTPTRTIVTEQSFIQENGYQIILLKA